MNQILTNNFRRIRPRIGSVIVMMLMTLVSIFFAVYVTGLQQVKGHIALVTASGSARLSTPELSVQTVRQKPPYSALVRQQYDAFIIDDGGGRYTVETLRGNEFKTMLQTLMKNPKAKIPAQSYDRSTGVNVIGFLMIFLSMSALFYMFPFAEDKEQGQLLRIAASPLSFPRYLAAHCVFCLCSFVPAWAMLAVLGAAGWSIGFSVGQYAALFLLLAVLGISFAILLHAWIKKPDNANMLGNSVIILSSTLAGCFYSFSKGNRVLDTLVRILPQKQLINLALDVQHGTVWAHPFPIFYILAVSAAMFTAAYAKLHHDFIKRA